MFLFKKAYPYPTVKLHQHLHYEAKLQNSTGNNVLKSCLVYSTIIFFSISLYLKKLVANFLFLTYFLQLADFQYLRLECNFNLVCWCQILSECKSALLYPMHQHYISCHITGDSEFQYNCLEYPSCTGALMLCRIWASSYGAGNQEKTAGLRQMINSPINILTYNLQPSLALKCLNWMKCRQGMRPGIQIHGYWWLEWDILTYDLISI